MKVGRGHAGWHCCRVPSGLQETIVGHENRDFRVPLFGDNRGKNTDSPYHSAQFVIRIAFTTLTSDHVFEIQDIIIVSHGW